MTRDPGPEQAIRDGHGTGNDGKSGNGASDRTAGNSSRGGIGGTSGAFPRGGACAAGSGLEVGAPSAPNAARANSFSDVLASCQAKAHYKRNVAFTQYSINGIRGSSGTGSVGPSGGGHIGCSGAGVFAGCGRDFVGAARVAIAGRGGSGATAATGCLEGNASGDRLFGDINSSGQDMSQAAAIVASSGGAATGAGGGAGGAAGGTTVVGGVAGATGLAGKPLKGGA